MPISSISGYDSSVASGSIEELEIPLPIEIPKSEKDDCYSINIHGVKFYSSEFPATTKYQKWSLRRDSMPTPAHQHEAQSGNVICSHWELFTASGIQKKKDRDYEFKIPYNVINTSVYLEMGHDKGTALEMGCRIEFTYVKINAKTWMWAHNIMV